MSAAVSVLGALSGCMGSMVCVEALAKERPSAMNLLTFSTFLFISLEGLLVTSRLLAVRNKIPLRGYAPVVITFFLTNVINNQALNFHVPVPLHIIFRSGSLLTSLVMNRLILGRRYSLRKYLSVLTITVGIIVCTLATARVEKKEDEELEDPARHYNEWLLGIGMLTLALVISSLLAICQERMYAKYGKHPREAMFYIHAISLPFFAFAGADIWKSAVEFSDAPAAQLPETLLAVLPFARVSHLWVELIGACVTQWVCIMFVYRLGSELDSLSVTLVVTLRKFLSLVVSIFWFQNTFTPVHWAGAAMVFGGTLAFSLEGKAAAVTSKQKSS